MKAPKLPSGPWEVVSDPSHYYTLSSVTGGNTRDKPPVRELYIDVGGHLDVPTQEAVTKLISVAPEMAEALNEYLETDDICQFQDKFTQLLLKAGYTE